MKKAILKVFSLCLILVIFELKLFGQTNTNPIFGAIRWDHWVPKGNNTSKTPYQTLAPNIYHNRVPFFGSETGTNSVDFDANSDTFEANNLTKKVNIMNKEISYAKEAGLGYFAFVWYTDGYFQNYGKETFKSIPFSEKNFKMCYILVGDDNGYDNSIPNNYSYQDLEAIATDLGRVDYQTVLNGRPLMFLQSIVRPDRGISEFYATTIKTKYQSLYPLKPLPYFVSMKQPWYGNNLELDITLDKTINEASGGSAQSAYIEDHGTNHLFSSMKARGEAKWLKCKDAGMKIIPWVSTGFDRRPRVDNPVYWEPANDAYTVNATPNEIKQHLQSAVDFIKNNPINCEANTGLIYSWNEHDEGGHLCPTIVPGTGPNYTINRENLDAVKEILNPNVNIAITPTNVEGIGLNGGTLEPINVISNAPWSVTNNSPGMLTFTKTTTSGNNGYLTVNVSAADTYATTPQDAFNRGSLTISSGNANKTITFLQLRLCPTCPLTICTTRDDGRIICTESTSANSSCLPGIISAITNYPFVGGNTTRINVNAASWSASTDANSWLKYIISSNSITLNPDPNTTTNSRTGTLSISTTCNGNPYVKQIMISQLGLPCGISASNNNLSNLPASGGAQSSIAVTSNSTWSASVGSNTWIKFTTTSNSIIINPDPNTSTATRNGTVTLSTTCNGTTYSTNIAVSQIGVASSCSISLSNISVSQSCNGNNNTQKTVGWTVDSGSGTFQISFDDSSWWNGTSAWVNPNSDPNAVQRIFIRYLNDNSRKSYIDVKPNACNLSGSFTSPCANVPTCGISASNNNLSNLPASGGAQSSIAVTSNSTWSASVGSNTWIKFTTTSNSIIINPDPNTSTATRNGTVTLSTTCNGTTYSTNIAVSQIGVASSCSISLSNISVSQSCNGNNNTQKTVGWTVDSGSGTFQISFDDSSWWNGTSAWVNPNSDPNAVQRIFIRYLNDNSRKSYIDVKPNACNLSGSFTSPCANVPTCGISASNNNLSNLPASGGAQSSIAVTSNSTWSASVGSNTWIKFTTTSNSIIINPDPNTSTATRNGTVTLSTTCNGTTYSTNIAVSQIGVASSCSISLSNISVSQSCNGNNNTQKTVGWTVDSGSGTFQISFDDSSWWNGTSAWVNPNSDPNAVQRIFIRYLNDNSRKSYIDVKPNACNLSGSFTSPCGSPSSGRIGIENTKAEENNIFDISPNPTSKEISIRISLINEKASSLVIMNSYGKSFLTKTLNNDKQSFSFDMSGFTSGVYFVVLETNINKYVRKIVKE